MNSPGEGGSCRARPARAPLLGAAHDQRWPVDNRREPRDASIGVLDLGIALGPPILGRRARIHRDGPRVGVRNRWAVSAAEPLGTDAHDLRESVVGGAQRAAARAFLPGAAGSVGGGGARGPPGEGIEGNPADTGSAGGGAAAGRAQAGGCPTGDGGAGASSWLHGAGSRHTDLGIPPFLSHRPWPHSHRMGFTYS